MGWEAVKADGWRVEAVKPSGGEEVDTAADAAAVLEWAADEAEAGRGLAEGPATAWAVVWAVEEEGVSGAGWA